MNNRLRNALNEKDVENAYRAEFLKEKDSKITSPYGSDGLFECNKVRRFNLDISV